MRKTAFAAVLLFAATLAACSSGTTSTTPVTAPSATPAASPQVRVLNGSPDAGAVDVRIDSPASAPLTTGTTYKAITGYSAISASTTHVVYVSPAGATSPSLQCALATFPNQQYTIVVAGTAAAGAGTTAGLQCEIGVEPAFAIPSGQYAVIAHEASPALAAQNPAVAVISFGTFTPGKTDYSAPLANTIFDQSPNTKATATPPPARSGNLGTTPVVLTGATAPPGVGFWFAPATNTAPTSVPVTFLPSQASAGGQSGTTGASDPNNVMPNGASQTKLDIYLIDAAGGGFTAVGFFD